MTNPFDVTALRVRVDPAVARQESRERIAAEGRRVGVRLGHSWGVFQSVVLLAGAGVLAALVVVAVQFLFGADSADITTVILAVLMVAPLAVARIRSHFRVPRDSEGEEYRLTRFAQVNGLTYRSGELAPEHSAALFSIGTARVANHIVGGRSPRPFEAADYSFDTWAARTRMAHQVSYIGFELGSPLPPLTLMTKAPRAVAPAWAPAAGQEPLQIDGMIASRFTIFSSRATTEPVRHLLSPDVQDAVIEVTGSCDIEIVGDRIYVVTRRRLPMTGPGYWEWVEDLTALVALLEARGRAEQTPAIVEPDAARRRRREALFTAPAGGREAAIGCLVPLVVGIVAAAVITKISTG